MTSESWDSARAQLIRTRRGACIDESLLPEARRECLETLRSASEAMGEDVVRLARGDPRHLEGGPLTGNPNCLWSYHTPVRDALDTLRKELLRYQLPEEEKARELARARSSVPCS